MAIEIVDFPIKNGGSFHSYVSLPEGIGAILRTIEATERFRKQVSLQMVLKTQVDLGMLRTLTSRRKNHGTNTLKTNVNS